MLMEADTPYCLDRDVSQRDGEIFFQGDIRINGNVHGGVRVYAGGDLLVTGNVDIASLRADGNIKVGGTVTGSSKTALRAGGSIELGSAYSITARAEGDITVATNIEISRMACGGQLTLMNGVVRDSHLSALKGIWVPTVTCSAIRACTLTAGVHYAFEERYSQILQRQKRLAAEQQTAMGALAPLLRRACDDFGTRKRNEYEITGKMRDLRENDNMLRKYAKMLLRLEKCMYLHAVPLVVCEKMIEKGTLVTLQRYSQPLGAPLAGPLTLVVNEEKQALGKLPGAQGLQKIRQNKGADA